MPVMPPNVSLQSYSAIVLGATGNVGREIVRLLVASSTVRQVVLLNRRQTQEFGDTAKVREVVVTDMDTLGEAAERAATEIGATVAFCAIGVGKGTRTMTDAALRKIEVQYPEAFARGCKAGGVLAMGVLTAAGADIRSTFKYVRIIGEKEQAVIGVGIAALGVYKPSVIFGNSNTPPFLQTLFPAVQPFLPSRYHAVHKNELALAMVEGTQRALVALQLQPQGQGGASAAPLVNFYEYADMKPLFSRNNAGIR